MPTSTIPVCNKYRDVLRRDFEMRVLVIGSAEQLIRHVFAYFLIHEQRLIYHQPAVR